MINRIVPVVHRSVRFHWPLTVIAWTMVSRTTFQNVCISIKIASSFIWTVFPIDWHIFQIMVMMFNISSTRAFSVYVPMCNLNYVTVKNAEPHFLVFPLVIIIQRLSLVQSFFPIAVTLWSHTTCLEANISQWCHIKFFGSKLMFIF